MKPQKLSQPGQAPVLFRAGIRFGECKIYSGANRYHGSTVIGCQLELGILAGVTTAQLLPDFRSFFLERFQTLASFLPNNGLSEDFKQALESSEGIDLSQLVLEAVLAVEHAVSFAQHDLGSIGFAAIDRDGNLPFLVWETSRPKVSMEAMEVALVGVNELLERKPRVDFAGDQNSFEGSLESLRKKVRRRRLAPSTAVIRLEAKRRGIPCQTLRRQHLLLGEGRLQHHLFASMTDATSMAAQKICADKRQTNRRLSELRLPAPSQIKVGTMESALEAAKKIGFPLVVKPVRGKKGRGISVGLGQLDEIDAAFNLAHNTGADVIIEKFVPGLDYRLLIVAGRFVAAVHRRPPSIIGDGRSSVESLIDRENENPYRDGFRGFKIVKDDEVMRHLTLADLSLSDVPLEGREIFLRTAANVSTGGLPIDVTDQLHPDNRIMAERAALGVGLDVAGIDFISPDINRPYHENGGAIVEVNARPGLDIHTWPVAGKSRNVAGDLLEQMFPGQQQGRLPVALVCGDRGTGTIARALEKILRGAERSVALTTRRGNYTDGVIVKWPRRQQSQEQKVLLRDPGIDTLVSTVSLRQTAESGLIIEQASVSVIIDRAKAGRADRFYQGVDVVDRATTDCLVIGSGNLMLLGKLPANNKRRLILVSSRASDPGLQVHLKNRGVAVTIQWHQGENQILLLAGAEILAAYPVSRLPQADTDKGLQRLQTAFCYAIAAAYALGLTTAQLGASLVADVEMVDAW